MKRFGGMLVALWGLATCEPVTTPSSSGDFAVLARSAEGYEEAVRGGTLTFPQDHAAHPGYRIEW